jgi:hypothetical protein
MNSLYLTIILIFFIILSLLYLYDKKIIENYETYSYGPFNYMTTGADPLTFYKYPIYRNPYMFPYKFYSSYPYPYMTNYETNI